MTKTDLIHIRIDPETKIQSEKIFENLGVNMSYAISIFLNQVIMNNGFPFDVKLKQKTDEIEKLAKIIESTGENGNVSLENQKIIHLFSTGQIDYETAVFAIKRNFNHERSIRIS